MMTTNLGISKPKHPPLTEAFLAEQITKIKEQLKPDFQEDFLYTYKLNSAYQELSNEIIEDVMFYIWLDNIMDEPDFKPNFSMQDLFRQTKWQWKTERGSLVTRLSKWCREETGKKLSNDTATAIGNLIAPVIGKTSTYYVDFTRNFTWRAGDFGDDGSCFWDGSRETRRYLEADGRFYAMRLFRYVDKPRKTAKAANLTPLRVFHETDKGYCIGVSRAWLGLGILPVPKSTVKNHKKTCYIVFNGYGYKHNFFARLFTGIFGLDYKHILLTNNDSTGNGLFVNDGGYLMGSKAIIEPVDKYDFGMAYGSEWSSIVTRHKECFYEGPGAYFKLRKEKEGIKARERGLVGYYSLQKMLKCEYQLIN